jgi:hypothetical protein
LTGARAVYEEPSRGGDRDEFWVKFTLARVLQGTVKQGQDSWTAAAAYYQEALDLRPKAVAVHNNLGLVLANVGWLEDGADDRGGEGGGLSDLGERAHNKQQPGRRRPFRACPEA